MTPALLAAIQASLANPAHAWDLLGIYDHGPTIVDDDVNDEFVSRTLTLISHKLNLMLTVTTEGAGTEIVTTVVYEGTTFRTRSPALFAKVGAMVLALRPGIEDDFIAHISREVA